MNRRDRIEKLEKEVGQLRSDHEGLSVTLKKIAGYLSFSSPFLVKFEGKLIGSGPYGPPSITIDEKIQAICEHLGIIILEEKQPARVVSAKKFFDPSAKARPVYDSWEGCSQ